MTALHEPAEAVLAAADLSSPKSSGPTMAPIDLAALVDQHQADVWRYLRYLGADRADADDLTQETFLVVSRSKFEQRSDRETSAYLRSIARNQLLMLRRLQRRAIDTVQLEAAEQVWAAHVPDEGMNPILSTLADCLKTIDGRAREAIHLFYREDLSRKAMAAALSMKPEGIKTLLRRTRDALRDCIERKTDRQT